MGFHLAEDSGQYFPRVPHFWNPEDLMFKAQQLGPVDMGKFFRGRCFRQIIKI